MWLPGFERLEIPGRAGVPYDEYDDPKCVWHTTEGSSIEGAIQAYRAYPPQLIVDPWRRRKVQHITLANAGYALWNEDVDDSRCIQVETVGYAADTPHWSSDVYKWLGEEVALPLWEYFGVPLVAVWKGFKAPSDVNYVLASASSPLRLTQREVDAFSGHMAHQHVPLDSHWDAGGFRCQLMLDYAKSKLGSGGPGGGGGAPTTNLGDTDVDYTFDGSPNGVDTHTPRHILLSPHTRYDLVIATTAKNDSEGITWVGQNYLFGASNAQGRPVGLGDQLPKAGYPNGGRVIFNAPLVLQLPLGTAQVGFIYSSTVPIHVSLRARP